MNMSVVSCCLARTGRTHLEILCRHLSARVEVVSECAHKTADTSLCVSGILASDEIDKDISREVIDHDNCALMAAQRLLLEGAGKIHAD